ncbi:MAG TPA: extensin-like protein [Paracoccus sp.]|nr:extensin-like protein [Paracoccus sp. (in: a-proteobacteria)]
MAGWRILAGALVLLALTAGATAQAPERSPMPVMRPQPSGAPQPATERAPRVTAETLAAAIASTSIEPATEAAAPASRPQARPEHLIAPPETAAIASAGDTALAPALGQRPMPRSADAYARYTRAALRVEQGLSATTAQRGLCGSATLEGQRLTRITSPVEGCGVAEPVRVSAVAGIRLSQAATLDCDTARAFDRWVRHEMQPAIGRTGGGVTQIRVAAHYTCRPRNNRSGARVSEHGRGRAIDIAGFRLADGRVVAVLSDWRSGPFQQALRQMHASACGIFRTTLGPGSDGHHEDHFHFDMAHRRGGGTFCR